LFSMVSLRCFPDGRTAMRPLVLYGSGSERVLQRQGGVVTVSEFVAVIVTPESRCLNTHFEVVQVNEVHTNGAGAATLAEAAAVGRVAVHITGATQRRLHGNTGKLFVVLRLSHQTITPGILGQVSLVDVTRRLDSSFRGR